MNKIYVKINGYDEISNSLLVSFASDKTKSQDPADYPSLAYQPYVQFPDITDPNEVVKRIAVAGLYQTEQQAIKEAFIADSSKEAAYKTMIGQTLSFNASDLVTPVDGIIDNQVVV
jgi:hypothetical protein